ncbi:Hypothetical_protein [Hexamita inflata]|uniref:Hypothetical_protein n=1 Tax=Hexamita inflata TaxID=28002 RepID=A0AA86NJ34_9EUKA|nr:Hypothetical protein HINF_LOCUS8320 [Hexamita inflata]
MSSTTNQSTTLQISISEKKQYGNSKQSKNIKQDKTQPKQSDKVLTILQDNSKIRKEEFKAINQLPDQILSTVTNFFVSLDHESPDVLDISCYEGAQKMTNLDSVAINYHTDSNITQFMEDDCCIHDSKMFYEYLTRKIDSESVNKFFTNLIDQYFIQFRSLKDIYIWWKNQINKSAAQSQHVIASISRRKRY